MIGVRLLSSLFFWMASNLWAQTPSETTPVPKQQPPVKTRKAKVEKEAEGTRATSHFEKDPVIKSQYEYEGTPLEVDPD